MKSRYLITKAGVNSNQYGDLYPDMCTFDMSKFRYTEQPTTYTLTSVDCYRFDLVSFAFYNTSDYTDLLLLLNGKLGFRDLSAGDQILIPSITDINNFYFG